MGVEPTVPEGSRAGRECERGMARAIMAPATPIAVLMWIVRGRAACRILAARLQGCSAGRQPGHSQLHRALFDAIATATASR